MPLQTKKVGDKAPTGVVQTTGGVPSARADVVSRVGDGSGVLRPGSIGGLKTYAPDDIETRINLLLYGEPGIGKTQLAGSACLVDMLCPVLVVNVEDGAKTLKGAYAGNPNITLVSPKTFGQIQRLFDDLYRNKGAGFKTVVFDNATEGQKVGIEYIFDGDTQSTDFSEFESATWKNQGWNRSSEQMRKMIRYFRMLPMNTIFIAWAKDYSKPDDKIDKWGPAFSNALAREVPGMFDSVFYYKWGRVENKLTRLLQTKGTDSVVAKDRDGGHTMPDVVKNPTMEILCKHWGYL